MCVERERARACVRDRERDCLVTNTAAPRERERERERERDCLVTNTAAPRERTRARIYYERYSMMWGEIEEDTRAEDDSRGRRRYWHVI